VNRNGTAKRGIVVALSYRIVTAWEAELDNVAVDAGGDDAVGECYDDSAFSGAVAIDGGGTVGLNSVTLTAADGEKHDGTAGTGVRNTSGNWETGGIGNAIRWIELEAGRFTFINSSSVGILSHCL